ncbi:MAG: hypothetical protein SOY00_02410 [Prevotella sp.]|nr:hypothetical protein [Prevotella sp.]
MKKQIYLFTCQPDFLHSLVPSPACSFRPPRQLVDLLTPQLIISQIFLYS